MKRFLPYILLLGFLGYGCNRIAEDQGKYTRTYDPEYSKYAEKYAVRKAGDFLLITVFNPWQKAGNTEFTYILGKDESAVPDSLKGFPFIKIPLEKVILMSATFVPMLDTLGELNSVTGVSGSRYMYNEELRDLISDGLVKDVGYDLGLNYESIIELNPDVLFIYGIESGITQTISKLEDLGIQAVLCADYLENDPLGRAEWLKFFSLFYEKFDAASGIFREIEYRYDSIKLKAIQSGESPSVFVGLPWKDTWYVAGGESFIARFIEDAGGEYVWSDFKSSEAEPYDLESVYGRVMDADIWLNPGVAESLDAIIKEDTRFENLSSFRRGKVYNNNRRLTPQGGNDYWESGIIHPDRILEDLMNIFDGKTDTLYYYKRLR